MKPTGALTEGVRLTPRGLRFLKLLGAKTLILGEVKSGKTKLTAELLKEAMNLGYAARIAVLDLSPAARTPSGELVGAPLTAYVKIAPPIKYLRPLRVRAPRIEGRSGGEVLKLARENAKVMEILLDELLKEPREILFVDDVSLYLHAGKLKKLLLALSKANTAILNGYYGNRLNDDKGSGLSLKERSLMGKLAEKMDLIVRMEGSRW